MKTLIDIDEGLMKKAMRSIGGLTKKETVEVALEELIKLKMREKLKGMAGSEVLDISLKDLKDMRHRRAKKHHSAESLN